MISALKNNISAEAHIKQHISTTKLRNKTTILSTILLFRILFTIQGVTKRVEIYI